MGSFQDRISALQAEVGNGSLTGRVSFDTPYAVPLHEEGWQNFLGRFGPHPIEHYHLGGGPRYLEGPLFEGSDRWMRMIADSVLGTGGPREGMRNVVDQLLGEAINRAPLRTGHLISTGRAEVEG